MISGFISPANASIVFGEYSAYVNSSGYYTISLPSGSYTVSVTDNGYYPLTVNITLSSNIIENFTLAKEPAPTSVKTESNITASGYNVTVSNLTSGNGNISLTYNATKNGTLTVALPYDQVKNATVSDILSSRLYINGIQYHNFTVAISSSGGSYTVILTVKNLSGDPALVWLYSPSATPPKAPVTRPSTSPGISSTELYAIIGAVIAVIAIVSVVAIVRRR